MPKNRKIVKLAILLIAPFSVIAALGAYAGTFWFYFSQEKWVAASTSPSARFRALTVTETGGCGSRKSTFVVIERRLGILKTGEFTAFCLADDAGDMQIHWTGPDELTISCLNCSRTKYEMYGPRWGRATFRYELGAETK
jgi:hypothetical protein